MTTLLIISFAVADIAVLMITGIAGWQLVNQLRGKSEEITIVTGKDIVIFSFAAILCMQLTALVTGDFLAINIDSYLIFSASFGFATAGLASFCRRHHWIRAEKLSMIIPVVFGTIAGAWWTALPA